MENSPHSRLRSFRRIVGDTAKDVAEITGLSQTTVTRIELGEVSPQHETATRLLAYCDQRARKYRVPIRDRVTSDDLLPRPRA